jgi:hypothetical protein
MRTANDCAVRPEPLSKSLKVRCLPGGGGSAVVTHGVPLKLFDQLFKVYDWSVLGLSLGFSIPLGHPRGIGIMRPFL